MPARLILAVSAAWLFAGAVQGLQTSLGASLQGQTQPLAGALLASLIQTVPWIPMTLAVIGITVRYPLSRRTLIRSLPVHVGAALVVAFLTNVLVVLGFWVVQGQFDGLGTLVQRGAFWMAIRLHTAFLTYAVIVAGTQAVMHYRAARDRELHTARLEGHLARARVEALNAQIRPHFLFNTLHTIGQLWREGRAADAETMLDHLGSLFHRVQESTRDPEVPLADELALVRDYLAIEQVRFRDRLRVTIESSPAARACLVPPLLLQPLVENAIRHGISATSSAGKIVVRAVAEDGQLQITVRDDGLGPTVPSPSPGAGTGLRNTHERLRELYGEAATLVMAPASPNGTVVTVTLPLRTGEPSDA